MDFPPLTLATPTKGGKAPLSQTPGMGLPFEIWLRILRLLERYPSALVACQQTCFDWAYPCRLMLNSISTSLLRTSSDLEALIQDIHGAPELQSIIDSLLVLPDATYHSELLNTVPLTLPAKLSKVTFMSLIGNPTTPINPMSWNLYSGFGLTERLDLDEVLVHSLADLLRVLCSLPKLSCFTGTDINWVRIGRPPSAPNKQRIRLPSFQHLHLGVYKRDSGFVTEFMRWFVGSSGVTELKTLQLHLHKPHDYSELSLILRHGQFSFLKTLEFELVPTTLTSSFSALRIGKIFPHVEELEISGLGYSDIPIFTTILSSLPQSLTKLKFYFLVTDVKDAHCPNLEPVDSLLSKKIPRDCSIFCGVESRELDDLEFFGEAELPLLFSQGVLYE